MTNKHCAELVKWRARPDVSAAKMIAAVDGLLADLQKLPGFISQTLYQGKDGLWVDLYFWEAEEQAIASLGLMEGKASFSELMALIVPDSVTIDLMHRPG
ncbi:MAG: hypothetical protein L3J33_10525 [Rhodobacteraceae bacterium]|nr:hypothetical protein [Paracoccaceae bacterium]